MPWYVSSWVLWSDIYLYQETLYRSESCKRKLRRTSPCGPPGMATRARPTYRRRYSCSTIACKSTWLLSAALSPGRYKRHGAIDVVLLFEHTLCVNFLFALVNVIALIIFQYAVERMNVNLSNEFNFSDVHRAMNHSESLAKLT